MGLVAHFQLPRSAKSQTRSSFSLQTGVVVSDYSLSCSFGNRFELLKCSWRVSRATSVKRPFAGQFCTRMKMTLTYRLFVTKTIMDYVLADLLPFLKGRRLSRPRRIIEGRSRRAEPTNGFWFRQSKQEMLDTSYPPASHFLREAIYMFHCTGLFLISSRSTWHRTTLLLGLPAQEGGTTRLPWACESIPGWVKAP